MAKRRSGEDLRPLMRRLGHQFDNDALLREALTHPSASTPARPDNQRLEFLGDRVLALVIAETLIARYPQEAEGALTHRFHQLVRKETCAEIARALDLGEFIHLGRSEALAGGRRKTALLGDAAEALIAAVYFDGGLPAAREVVDALWGPHIERQREAPRDAKTTLQEWAQGRGDPAPSYEIVERTGPDHAPQFTVRALLSAGLSAEGTAASKRAAEQIAAARLLTEVETDHGA